MVTPSRTLLLSYVAFITTCLAEPPSRLNLYRFFMGFGPETNVVQKISFNPDAGLRYREHYEKKYGPRGALLIERFGKGIGPEEPFITDISEPLFTESDQHLNELNLPKGKSKRDKKEKTRINNTPGTDVS